METLRVNLFYQVHKGLRALLNDTLKLLQLACVTEAVLTEQLLQQVEEALHLVHEHGAKEDCEIFPLLQQHAPEVLDSFTRQHQQDHVLEREVRNQLQVLQAADTNNLQAETASRLLQAFTDFAAFNLMHMNAEEQQVNPVLWQHYSDAQLLQLQKEMVARIPIALNSRYAYWMMKGLAKHEIINWMDKVRSTAPKPVYENLWQIATLALPPQLLYDVGVALKPPCLVV